MSITGGMLLGCIGCLGIAYLFCKQKTAYELRISDWSSDVCSSDLPQQHKPRGSVEFSVREESDDQGHRQLERNRGDSIRPVNTGDNGRDRKSVVEGKSVSVRVDLGGRRIIKKKTKSSYHQGDIR